MDATFLYINPTVDVYFDETKTALTAAEVQTKVNNAIENFESTNLGTFINRKFRFSKFVNAVDFADPSITSSLTTLLLEKRFEPSTTTKATYTIAFNNPIHHPHEGHIYSLSSSAFTFSGREAYLDDDGFGNVRVYYIDASTNTRVVMDDSAGTINYTLGVVKLDSFGPSAFSGSNISVYVKPDKENIDSIRNQILLIANAKVTMYDDSTTQLLATTVTATTSGVTTNTPSTASQLTSSSVY